MILFIWFHPCLEVSDHLKPLILHWGKCKINVFRYPNILSTLVYCIIYIVGVPIGVFQSMFQVVALETFKLPADQNGLLMSYIGILTMVRQHKNAI